MPKKSFVPGEVLRAADVNEYLTDSKNVVLNSGFDIWQRGLTFTNPASGTYTTDRWRLIYDGTGATRVISRVAFDGTAGNVVPIAGAQNGFFRFNQTVAGSGGNFNVIQNVIEDVRTFAGNTVTLSFYARASANITTGDVYLGQVFGSGGSTNTVTSKNTFNLTTSWQRFSATYTFDSIASKTIGTNSYIYVEFGMPENITFQIDVWGFQLEEGSTATPYSRNNGSIGAELQACQRYFENGTMLESFLALNSASFVLDTFRSVFFKVPKAFTPTMGVTVTSGNNVPAGNGAVHAWNSQMFVHKIAVNNTSFPYNSVVFDWTASAEF
jgi:hypothetical protein